MMHLALVLMHFIALNWHCEKRIIRVRLRKDSMPIKFIGIRTEKNPPFFAPDRLENVKHDAHDDFNMTVYDANGRKIWGRRIEGSYKEWSCQLHDWIWYPTCS